MIFSMIKDMPRNLAQKKKNEARRKIDAYLEKKSLKELLKDYAEDDYDYDWG